MEDADKRRFDALESLCAHAWKEFENKSAAEWKLSLAIWAAGLGIAAALLRTTSDSVKSPVALETALLVALAFLVSLHLYFLWWIQKQLLTIRKFIAEAQSEMRVLAGLKKEPPDISRAPWHDQPSLFVQFWITVVVAIVVYAIFRLKAV